jgi:hypothetical protein
MTTRQTVPVYGSVPVISRHNHFCVAALFAVETHGPKHESPLYIVKIGRSPVNCMPQGRRRDGDASSPFSTAPGVTSNLVLASETRDDGQGGRSAALSQEQELFDN